MINPGDVLVASREVEDALHSDSAMAEVAVIGAPDDRRIEAITALVVTKDEGTFDELIAHAKGLAGYKVARRCGTLGDCSTITSPGQRSHFFMTRGRIAPHGRDRFTEAEGTGRR